MDLSINYYNNISFNSRMSRLTKIELDRTLSKMVNEDKADLNTLLEKSGYKKNAIVAWFNDKFNMSPKQFYKQKRKDEELNKFIELYNQGLNVYQMSEKLMCPVKSITLQLRKLGLKPKFSDINQPDRTILDLIDKGYSLSEISKKLNCSLPKINTWVKENLGEDIFRYRRRKGIKKSFGNTEKAKKEKSILKKYFSEGKGIRETANLMGVSKTKIIYLKDKYNFQTAMERGQELMEQFLPDMVQAKDSIITMARFFGLSRDTVARRIKELYGKNYYDIKFKE